MASKKECLELHRAIQREDVARVHELLARKISDPNMKYSENGLHPLGAAVYHGSHFEKKHKIMDLLIKYGADVNIVDNEGNTPLHVASTKGVICAARKLLKNKADPNKKNNQGFTVLWFVTFVEDKVVMEEMMDLLIKYGADVNIVGKDGNTLLHLAALSGIECVARKLLCNKADPNQKNNKGVTALAYAVYTKDIDALEESVDLLLKYGEDVEIIDEDGNILLNCASSNRVICATKRLSNEVDSNKRNKKGATALFSSASTKDHDMIEEIMDLLIKYGADVNIVDVDGDTPLHSASHDEVVCAVKKLLRNNAEPNKKNNKGITALFYAASTKDQVVMEEMMDVLIKYGADANIVDELGNTPLHLASFMGAVRAARFLLIHGADPNKSNNQGFNVLWCFCFVKNQEVLEDIMDLLINCGADLNFADEIGNTPLHSASKEGVVCAAKKLLNSNADPNKKNDAGDTPFFYAACTKHQDVAEELMDLLIKHGAHVSMADKDGNTPLHWASSNGAVCAVKALLREKADSNAKNNYGATALCHAVQLKDSEEFEEIMDLLIQYGADVNNADIRGGTPLHLVSSLGCVWAAKKLLRNKADPDKKKDNGATALHVTVSAENQEAVEEMMDVLIKYGADVNIGDMDGGTPLHWASFFGVVCAAQKLLNNKADPNKKGKDGYTALHMVSRNIMDDGTVTGMGELLKKYGADVNMEENNGRSPLHVACEEGNICMVQFLLGNYADIVNMRDSSGNSPLNLALEKFDMKPRDKIVELLLAQGADVNNVTYERKIPLIKAVKLENVSIVKMIIEHNADLNARDKMGRTALHHAVNVQLESTSEKIVELLISRGSDVNIACHHKCSPLHSAALDGHFNIVKMLLQRNADPNAVDGRRNTPLHYAVREKHRSIADMLVTFGADVNKRNQYCETAACSLSTLGEQRKQAASALVLAELTESSCDFVNVCLPISSKHDAKLNEKTSFLSGVVQFELAQDKEISVFISETINHSLNGRNFMLTWLTYYGLNGEEGWTGKKLMFLLNHTEDLSQIGYHRRNYLHVISFCFPKIIETFDVRLHLLDIITERHVDASVLNATDDNGWTPVHVMFIACIEYMKYRNKDVTCRNAYPVMIAGYLEKDFDFTIKDNQGASVIHYAASTKLIEALKLLLGKCESSFVNEGDIFGSTPLHYAVFAHNTDATKLLLDKGCDKNKKDCSGRTACELAELLGYSDIKMLLSNEDIVEDKEKEGGIVCGVDVHGIYLFTGTSTCYKIDTEEEHINQYFTNILSFPVLGSLEYQKDCFEEEANLVKKEVMRFVERFAEQYGRRYPNLAFDPKLRGSMGEGTKYGPPNEFDFLLIMDTLSEFCQVNSIDNCKAHTTLRDFIDVDDLLKLPPNKMIDALHIPLKKASSYPYGIGSKYITHIIELLDFSMKRFLSSHSTWRGSRLKFVSCDPMGVGLCLNVLFVDTLYKCLHISVDLVPCVILKMPVPVSVNIVWPVPLNFSKCQLYGLFRRGYDGFDLSSTDYEQVLLKSLPKAAIDAYVLSKAFPRGGFQLKDERVQDISSRSYTMKKALLLSVQLHQNVQEASRSDWIRGMISVALDMEEIFVKENDCIRCIFHAEDWVSGQNDNVLLSFS